MSRLILHIGSHKTGSTSLQKALRQGQRHKTLGPWRYLHATPRVDFNPLIECSGNGPQMQAVMRWNFLDRRLQTVQERGVDDCIISTEMLFWVDNQADIQALADRLRQQFDEIRVVVYLRRQDHLALSHRKQVVMGRAAYQFYGAQVQALPVYRPHMMRYFDYGAKLAKWEQVFGHDNVIVRRFQRQDLLGGDTVLDFWQFLDLPPPKDMPERANAAWNRSQLLAGLWLRQRGYPREAFLPHILELQDDHVLTPSRMQMRHFLTRFDRVNAALTQHYDPAGPAHFFDEDLSIYPEFSNDGYGAPRPDMVALEEAVLIEMQALGLALVPRNPHDGN